MPQSRETQVAKGWTRITGMISAGFDCVFEQYATRRSLVKVAK
jgi:hypothetical protein